MSEQPAEAFLFLTGATGHTGSRAAARLLAEGWRLRCLNFNPGHALHLPRNPRLEVIAGDVRRPEGWVGALRGASAVVHMAHVGFAGHVVSACREAGVRRLVSLSSTRRFTRFPERTARLVIEGEAAIEASGLDWTILRAAMIYGGARDNNIERLAGWLRRHRWAPLLAGGRNRLQPIFVDDLVEAIVRALARPEATACRALTVAGPLAVTQRELFEAVGRALGRPLVWVPVPYAAMAATAALLERVKVSGRPPLTRDQVRRTLEDKVFDIAEAREALGGWTPRPLAEGLRLKIAGLPTPGASH